VRAQQRTFPAAPLPRSYLQKRVLNSSKGPAVWALRAQTDKLEYAATMRRVLEATPNLFIREGGWVAGWLAQREGTVVAARKSCHMEACVLRMLAARSQPAQFGVAVETF
jgi:tRNA U34 5-carboxymethylaminomethyl modifying enzyme MnmG/GidA